jgi:hypothetical protein
MDQAFNAGSSCQVLALDFLRVPFARAMDVEFQMPHIGAPMIGVGAGQSEGLEQRFVLQEDLVFSAAKDISNSRRVAKPSNHADLPGGFS